MSFKTPLARATGLGTAREGVAHWWAQRITAVALVPLTPLFVVLVWVLAGADHATFRAVVGHPVVAVLMIVFLGAGFWHMKLGVQVIVEDYIKAGWLRTVALVKLTLGTFLLGAACAFSVLKMAFAS